MTLSEFGPHSVWFTSVGIPMGAEVKFVGIVDDETGETYDMDPYDYGRALDEEWWGLEGTVSPSGEWGWDGEGDPRDDNRNTVLAIKAFR